MEQLEISFDTNYFFTVTPDMYGFWNYLEHYPNDTIGNFFFGGHLYRITGTTMNCDTGTPIKHYRVLCIKDAYL